MENSKLFSVKLPQFDGEKEKWEMFKLLFSSRVGLKRNVKKLMSTTKPFILATDPQYVEASNNAEAKKDLESKRSVITDEAKKEEANELLYAFLLCSLSEDLIQEYRNAVPIDDGLALWRALCEEYDSKSVVVLIGFMTEVFNFKQTKDMSVKTYFSTLNNKITRLKSLDFPVPPKLHLGLAVNGLQSRYETSVNSVLSGTEVSLKILRDRLVSEEMRSEAKPEDSTESSGRVFKTTQNPETKEKCEKCGGNHKTEHHITCTYCNKNGHKESECFQKHPQLKTWGKKNGSTKRVFKNIF